MEGKCHNKPIVVTSAFPFVPAELNIAHFASTYVPADVICRYNNCFGRTAYNVCATDVHSVLASVDGKTIDPALVSKYVNSYNKTFRLLNIRFDKYIETDNVSHVKRVQNALCRLKDRKDIYKDSQKVIKCTQCKKIIPKRLAVGLKNPYMSFDEIVKDGRCCYCNGALAIEFEDHWFLRVSKNKDFLLPKIKELASKDVREAALNYLPGASDWNFSRNNNFGIPLPFDASRSLYLWFESLIGYQSLSEELGVEDPQYIHFIGKNIIYYHTIIWILLRKKCFSQASLPFISARGFLNFSKTSNDLIDIDKIINKYGADVVRFYLAQRVPDRCVDFYFTEDDINGVSTLLANKVGNLLNRIKLILERDSIGMRPQFDLSGVYYHEFKKLVSVIKDNLESNSLNGISGALLRYVKFLNSALNNEDARHASSPEGKADFMFMAATLMTVFAPLTTSMYEFPLFYQWRPSTVDNIFTVFKDSINPGCGLLWKKYEASV